MLLIVACSKHLQSFVCKLPGLNTVIYLAITYMKKHVKGYPSLNPIETLSYAM